MKIKKISKTDLAYAAGLVDGEGCIKIYKTMPEVLKDRKSPRYNLQVQLDSTCADIIYWLQDRFGGKIYLHKRNKNCKSTANSRDILRWYLFQNSTRLFLPQILPYLIIKKRHAVVAMEFLNCGYADPTKEKYYEKLMVINRRGLLAEQPKLRTTTEKLEKKDKQEYSEGVVRKGGINRKSPTKRPNIQIVGTK